MKNTAERLAIDLDDLTARFTQAFGELNARQMNWKPGPAIWSIAQNIDHLIVINTTYFPMVESLRAGTLHLPWWSRWKGAVTWFGNLIYNSVEPLRKRKMKTFPVWEPAQSDLPADILERFTNHQKAFKTFLLDCRDLVDAGAVIHSPANKNIVYTLERAFEIIVQHERRHLEQALEVKKLLPAE